MCTVSDHPVGRCLWSWFITLSDVNYRSYFYFLQQIWKPFYSCAMLNGSTSSLQKSHLYFPFLSLLSCFISCSTPTCSLHYLHPSHSSSSLPPPILPLSLNFFPPNSFFPYLLFHHIYYMSSFSSMSYLPVFFYLPVFAICVLPSSFCRSSDRRWCWEHPSWSSG